MSDMTPQLIHYPDAVTTPDDSNVAALAQAVDATIDAIGDALAEGDMDQATALVTAADATSDALLSAMGLADADDPDGT